MPQLCIVLPGIKSRLSLPTRKAWMAPLGPIELAAMVPNHWKVVIWNEFVQGAVPVGLIQSSDLAMLSGLTPSRYRAIDLARATKDAGTPLIAGGRDVIGWSMEEGVEGPLACYPSICTSACDQELMHQIVADAERGRLQPHYQLPSDKPTQFVLPRRDLINPGDYIAGHTIASSRGCNNKCPWCTVWGSGYHFKEPSLLEQEVQEIKARGGRFFVDVADSFGGNRDFVTQYVLPIYSQSGLWWGTEATVADLLEDNLIGQMAASGCRLAYIGVESVTRHLHKKSTRETTEEVIRRCRRAGIIVIGSLILDAKDNETEEEIREMANWAARWLDFAQFSLVALLHGSILRQVALKNGTVIEDDLEKYDGAHPTKAHQLSPETLSRMLEEVYTIFSPLWRVVWRGLRAPWAFKAPVLYAGFRYREGIPRA